MFRGGKHRIEKGLRVVKRYGDGDEDEYWEEEEKK